MKEQQKTASKPVTDGSWVDDEISGAALPDARLKARLGKVLKQLSQNVSGSIPTALENWSDIKGAYRLLSNDRVDDQAIASGHFEATRRRALSLTVLHAEERHPPLNRAALSWKLITNLPIECKRPVPTHP